MTLKQRNDIIVWATGKDLKSKSGTNKVRFFTRRRNKTWFKTFEFMNKTYPNWEVAILYNVEIDGSHKEIKKYYNFNNLKTYPSENDI